MKKLSALILLTALVVLFGCQGNGQTIKSGENINPKNNAPEEKTKPEPVAKIGEKFTLKMNESAKIEEADIKITVNRIGRKWLAKGGGESLDFVFSVERDGKIKSYSYPLPDLITAGEYKIEIVKTEPFGDGYAIFIVTKKDSIKKGESPVRKSE